jgi:hypothetical protein
MGAIYQKFCKNGHDMSIHRVTWVNGSACRLCRREYNRAYKAKNRENIRAINRRSLEKKTKERGFNRPPTASRRYNLKNKYGITVDEYIAMLKSQDGRCKICKTNKFSIKGPVIDHCHETNKIRGILCSCCNIGLGCFKDDKESLLSAVEYLDKNRS